MVLAQDIAEPMSDVTEDWLSTHDEAPCFLGANGLGVSEGVADGLQDAGAGLDAGVGTMAGLGIHRYRSCLRARHFS
jgi:hypothetical protein